MKRLLTILPVVAMTAALGATASYAEDTRPYGPGPGYQHGYMHGGGMHRGSGPGLDRMEAAIEQLELTDEQRAKVRSIIDGARDEFRKTRDKVHTARRALHDEMRKDTIDEGAVKALAEKKGVVQAEMAVLRARLKNQLGTVLTTEQREQLRAEMKPFGGPGMGQGRFGKNCPRAAS